MTKPKSRPKRWAEAVASAQAALSEMEGHTQKFADAVADLRSIQEEYENWKDNLPENLQQSPLGEKLEEVCNIDIENCGTEIESAISSAQDTLSECEGVELPRGFGKD